MSVMPARSSTSATGRVCANSAAVSSTVSRDGEVLEQAAGLHHRGDQAVGDGAARRACRRPRRCRASGWDRPSIMSMVEVLPAPLGPRKATISPGCDGQVEPVDRGDRAEALGQPAQGDGRERSSVARPSRRRRSVGRASCRQHRSCRGRTRSAADHDSPMTGLSRPTPALVRPHGERASSARCRAVSSRAGGRRGSPRPGPGRPAPGSSSRARGSSRPGPRGCRSRR